MGTDVSATSAQSSEDLEPEFTVDELLEQLYREYYVPPVGKGEFVVAMLVKRKQIPDQSARRIVAEALAAGRIVEVGERSYGRHRAMAYRLKESEAPATRIEPE